MPSGNCRSGAPVLPLGNTRPVAVRSAFAFHSFSAARAMSLSGMWRVRSDFDVVPSHSQHAAAQIHVASIRGKTARRVLTPVLRLTQHHRPKVVALRCRAPS